MKLAETPVTGAPREQTTWPDVHLPLVTTYWGEDGHGLLTVSAWSDKPRVTITGKTAKIEGAGCSEVVTLTP